jgi:hypothetical protein
MMPAVGVGHTLFLHLGLAVPAALRRYFWPLGLVN